MREKGEENGRVLMRTYQASANVSILAMTTVAIIEIMMIGMTIVNKTLYGPYLMRYRTFYLLLLALVLLYIGLMLFVKRDFPGRYKILNIANPISAVIFFAWSVGTTYNDFTVLGTVDTTVYMTFSLAVPLCFYLLPAIYAVIAIIADLFMLYVSLQAPNGSSLAINMIIFFVFQFVLGLSLLRVKRGLSREILITEAQKDEIERLSSARARFFSSVSHEIRTPINAVLGMDELILRESNEPETLEYAENIRTAGTALLELINDILDFSKMGAGKMEIIPVEYAVSSILHDLVVLLSTRAKEHGLAFLTRIDESIPSVLFGDEVRIKQIITNILTNAVKYTERGSVTLSVSAEKLDEEQVELFVSVKDTGIGIKEEDIQKLFTAYERIEEKRNRNVEGTGLGMNITTNLLAMMGSRLEVTSVYGAGSTFSFRLKQKVVSWEPIGDFEKAWRESLKGGKRPGFSFTAPEARILAVDDMKMNLSVLTGLLKPTKIQIDTAESGQECLNMVQRKKYDVIYLDHRMPEMDGRETLERMKTLPDHPNADTPVIALTANAMTGAKEEYLGYGFADYLSKPVSSHSLQKSLLAYLSKEKVLAVSDHAAGKEMPDEKELPQIDGLDREYALLHLSDEALFRSAVRDFCGVLLLHGKKLAQMYGRLPADDAFDAYRIQVHGMKSSAATIGIVPLAGMAKVLEDAAAGKDRECIDRLHPVFLQRWESYQELLSPITGDDEAAESEKKDYDGEAVTGLLTRIRSAMEDFDVDKADASLILLDGYRLPEVMKAPVAELKAAVAAVDSDRTAELVEQLLTNKEGVA